MPKTSTTSMNNNTSNWNPCNNIQLSIIIPVYNVEKYIRSCLESIYQQGLDDNCFEIIIINDGTEDRSIENIHNIISHHNNITIINQENQGTSVARNEGIKIAKGNYLLMIDPDDLLVNDSLNPMLNKALESQADIVVADYLRIKDYDIENKNIPTTDQTITFKEMTGKQLFLDYFTYAKCYVWCNMYRKDFLIDNDIFFIPGIIYEDQPFSHECVLKAQECILSNITLNIYRIRSGSAIDKPMNKEKAKSSCIAISSTWKLINHVKEDKAIIKKIQESVYHYFSIFICILVHCDLNKKEKKEIIDFLQSEVPDIHFVNSPIKYLLTYMFRKKPHTLLYLRHLYGIIVEDNILPFYRHYLKFV